jgi:hypothetical protein
MTKRGFLLDKSIFIGTNERELSDFVSTRTVILPETLFYECYTSNELSDKDFLKRLYRLLKAGAYVTYQLTQIMADEGKNLSPCTCIIDYSETNSLLSTGFREERTIGKEDINNTKKDRSKMAVSIKKLASKITQRLTNNLDLMKEIRRLDLNRKDRFQRWFEKADKNGIHDLASVYLRKYVIDPTEFCLSTNWVSWHYMRLIHAIALEYSYLEITGSCPKDDYAEHDLMDIQYITFLAKSDNLLTCDNKLRELAEVAFPDKKVYPNIQDISG